MNEKEEDTEKNELEKMDIETSSSDEDYDIGGPVHRRLQDLKQQEIDRKKKH